MTGSSPLARGSPHGPPHRQPGRGIIPARAGFTLVSACRSGVSGDHPRSRGVHAHWPSLRYPSAGSSPLARGSRRSSRWPCSTRTDHPRSRGVHRDRIPSSRHSPGSSPLARGSQEPGLLARILVGIIPARAGFTPSCTSVELDERDHPRSRGVHFTLFGASEGSTGSSPLARGSPPSTAGSRPCRPDHPHSRGVHADSSTEKFLPSGSSPLARGSLELVNVDVDWVRIIPARAGFTAAATLLRMLSWDHPRSRGVHVRGHCLNVLVRRIIPARAGFT